MFSIRSFLKNCRSSVELSIKQAELKAERDAVQRELAEALKDHQEAKQIVEEELADVVKEIKELRKELDDVKRSTQ